MEVSLLFLPKNGTFENHDVKKCTDIPTYNCCRNYGCICRWHDINFYNPFGVIYSHIIPILIFERKKQRPVIELPLK